MLQFKIPDAFSFIIQLIICISVVGLFVSILIDFTLYTRDDHIKREKKSIVETGTMTLFLFAFYLILMTKIGIVPIYDNNLKHIVITIGTIAIVCGCIMNIIGRFNLGRNWANHIKIYEEHTLVQKGMYKIVRHPLYSSIMLMFYGAVLVYRNILCFLAVTFIFIPFMYYRAKQEETLLIQAFSEYNEYKKRTGMFFPKIIKK
ncbi:isoprenylcysteine carboxylmethyltransferase family protein [Clostridium bowmanii]|uniref:methyltransferase family protein n=1 Tax=Clostridium bowmanii TaxID=132925 RepID=UPI001C0BC6B8|nr:isoprenylcysteine carboxylmethyltransferase family protein [Clostridium bowmanii]MBU3190359.1 isoprenylcysteine carboxylmethyltransferase family protein [Clostridium bowmanii]MCA1074871.1 isoprenylcysteine carboxylmethyltransferase family protein [Clostridium bowmanii]